MSVILNKAKIDNQEPVSKRLILFKVKEGENFNRRRHEVSALVNIVEYFED